MDECVWVGSAGLTPPGWGCFASVEAFLASRVSPTRIVIDDRAGALREADFLRLYERAPLARIERVVGPWRAGVGRTDPAWPLATTQVGDSPQSPNPQFAAAWSPLTSGYDELLPPPEFVDLSGVSVAVQISDPELRGMWVDSLKLAGAALETAAEADLLVSDHLEPLLSGPVPHLIVHLRPDPWNAIPRGIGFQPVIFCRNPDRLEADLMEEPPLVIAASVLDSPVLVLQRIAEVLL